jgi:hypothetical protein
MALVKGLTATDTVLGKKHNAGRQELALARLARELLAPELTMATALMVAIRSWRTLVAEESAIDSAADLKLMTSLGRKRRTRKAIRPMSASGSVHKQIDHRRMSPREAIGHVLFRSLRPSLAPNKIQNRSELVIASPSASPITIAPPFDNIVLFLFPPPHCILPSYSFSIDGNPTCQNSHTQSKVCNCTIPYSSNASDLSMNSDCGTIFSRRTGGPSGPYAE